MKAVKVKSKKHFDYRHIICLFITFGFVAVSVFVFPNAFGRIFEACRDFGISLAKWFSSCVLGVESGLNYTVNSLPEIPFFSFLGGYKSPSTSFPETWAGFCENWHIYWGLFVDKANILSYATILGTGVVVFFEALCIILPFIGVLAFIFNRYLKKQNNDYNKDSTPLKVFKTVTKPYLPFKLWLIDFFDFVRSHKGYWIMWICLWAFNFNAFTIVLELIAYYFYFVSTFDFLSLYIQVYKLMLDLWAVIDFVPIWAWFVIAYFIFNSFSIKIAYGRLCHNERCNRGFLNERYLVRFVDGTMGAGKTALLTDISLSDEVQLLCNAYEVILEMDMYFPYFSWINLEREIKRACALGFLTDIWSVRRWVRAKYKRWDKLAVKGIYGYDFNRYGLMRDDKLKLISVWEAIENYACAYFIYTVQSSYLISNYSIRSDKLMLSLGNFPCWNTDFFRRDSRLIDSFSRHAHILDFDMLRLGKKMLEDNPNRNAFGFGVYVISEVDKERKNSPELQEVKRNSDGCNQKNDLLNMTVKMCRHACVIANRVFVRINCDLQRTSSLNADFLELGEVLHIADKGDLSPVLPFFSPFYFLDFVYRIIKSRFDKFYSNYRYRRGDNTLLLYLYKGLVSKLGNWHKGVMNLFGCQTLKLQVQKGGAFGSELKKSKWYRMPKKVFSKRYSTDGHSAVFEARSELNFIGIEDLPEYETEMANAYELGLQNSHFWSEINALNKNS